MIIDITSEPISKDKNGNDVFLKDIWPTNYEVNNILNSSLTAEQFKSSYENIYDGEEEWRNIDVTKIISTNGMIQPTLPTPLF